MPPPTIYPTPFPSPCPPCPPWLTFLAVFLCKTVISGLTYEQIGRQFGNKDYSTVIRQFDKMAKQVREDESLRMTINSLEKQLS